MEAIKGSGPGKVLRSCEESFEESFEDFFWDFWIISSYRGLRWLEGLGFRA